MTQKFARPKQGREEIFNPSIFVNFKITHMEYLIAADINSSGGAEGPVNFIINGQLSRLKEMHPEP
jgi:hypothetical protein